MLFPVSKNKKSEGGGIEMFERFETFEEAKIAFEKKAEEIFSEAEKYEGEENFKNERLEDNAFSDLGDPDNNGFIRIQKNGLAENETLPFTHDGVCFGWSGWKINEDKTAFTPLFLELFLTMISKDVAMNGRKILKYHLLFKTDGIKFSGEIFFKTSK